MFRKSRKHSFVEYSTIKKKNYAQGHRILVQAYKNAKMCVKERKKRRIKKETCKRKNRLISRRTARSWLSHSLFRVRTCVPSSAPVVAEGSRTRPKAEPSANELLPATVWNRLAWRYDVRQQSFNSNRPDALYRLVLNISTSLIWIIPRLTEC